MQMTSLVALRDFKYAGRLLHKGDTFDAKPKDARLLVALKRAQCDVAAGHVAMPVMPMDASAAELVADVLEGSRRRRRPKKSDEGGE